MRDTKPSEKVPYELDGEPCSLYKLVVGEPGWAVSRINYSVDRIAELEQRITELAQQVRIRGERMELMWEVMRAHCPWPIEGGPDYMKDWFDDEFKAL